MKSQIFENFRLVQDRIASAATSAGRAAGEVRLVAVSKTHPAQSVRWVRDMGQLVFGESRVQEALPKIEEVGGDLEWHFIGHMQTNKIRKALPHFAMFHGVDTWETARQMDRIAGELGLKPRILLEVNTSREATKYGFDSEGLAAVWDDLLGLSHVQIEGLMTMAPVVESPELARPYFATLRELRDRLSARGGVALHELSMGMSGDFEAAIAEGATLVRVGSLIFGERALGNQTH